MTYTVSGGALNSTQTQNCQNQHSFCELFGESLPAPYTLESLKLHVKTRLSSLLCLLSTWCCQYLLISTGTCRMMPAAHLQLSIDNSCPLGTQQQSRRPPLLLLIDGTDWRTDTRPLRRRCCAYYVGSINNSMVQRTLDMSITLQRLDANAICFIYWVLHPLSWSRQTMTEQMDIRNHAHADQPRVKRLHWRHDLWCLVLTSRGIGLQFTAELKGTWNTRFLTSDPTDRDNM